MNAKAGAIFYSVTRTTLEKFPLLINGDKSLTVPANFSTKSSVTVPNKRILNGSYQFTVCTSFSHVEIKGILA